MAGDVRPPFGCMAITIAAMPPADPQPPHTTRYFSRRSNAEAKAVFPRFTQRDSGNRSCRLANYSSPVPIPVRDQSRGSSDHVLFLARASLVLPLNRLREIALKIIQRPEDTRLRKV